MYGKPWLNPVSRGGNMPPVPSPSYSTNSGGRPAGGTTVTGDFSLNRGQPVFGQSQGQLQDSYGSNLLSPPNVGGRSMAGSQVNYRPTGGAGEPGFMSQTMPLGQSTPQGQGSGRRTLSDFLDDLDRKANTTTPAERASAISGFHSQSNDPTYGIDKGSSQNTSLNDSKNRYGLQSGEFSSLSTPQYRDPAYSKEDEYWDNEYGLQPTEKNDSSADQSIDDKSRSAYSNRSSNYGTNKPDFYQESRSRSGTYNEQEYNQNQSQTQKIVFDYSQDSQDGMEKNNQDFSTYGSKQGQLPVIDLTDDHVTRMERDIAAPIKQTPLNVGSRDRSRSTEDEGWKRCDICSMEFSERKHFVVHCTGLMHTQKLLHKEQAKDHMSQGMGLTSYRTAKPQDPYAPTSHASYAKGTDNLTSPTQTSWVRHAPPSATYASTNKPDSQRTSFGQPGDIQYTTGSMHGQNTSFPRTIDTSPYGDNLKNSSKSSTRVGEKLPGNDQLGNLDMQGMMNERSGRITDQYSTRESGGSTDRRSGGYVSSERHTDVSRRSYGDGGSSERRPEAERNTDGNRRSYGDSSGRRPDGDRHSFGDAGSERRPDAERHTDGNRRSYGDGGGSERQSDGERRTYGVGSSSERPSDTVRHSYGDSGRSSTVQADSNSRSTVPARSPANKGPSTYDNSGTGVRDGSKAWMEKYPLPQTRAMKSGSGVSPENKSRQQASKIATMFDKVTDDSSIKGPKYFCKLCEIQCNQLLNFEQHLNGKIHRKKFLETQRQMGFAKFDCQYSMVPFGSTPVEKDKNVPRDIAKDPVKLHVFRVGMQLKYECPLCDLKYFQPAPWMTHVFSKKHIRKCLITEKANQQEFLKTHAEVPGPHWTFLSQQMLTAALLEDDPKARAVDDPGVPIGQTNIPLHQQQQQQQQQMLPPMVQQMPQPIQTQMGMQPPFQGQMQGQMNLGQQVNLQHLQGPGVTPGMQGQVGLAHGPTGQMATMGIQSQHHNTLNMQPQLQNQMHLQRPLGQPPNQPMGMMMASQQGVSPLMGPGVIQTSVPMGVMSTPPPMQHNFRVPITQLSSMTSSPTVTGMIGRSPAMDQQQPNRFQNQFDGRVGGPQPTGIPGLDLVSPSQPMHTSDTDMQFNMRNMPPSSQSFHGAVQDERKVYEPSPISRHLGDQLPSGGPQDTRGLRSDQDNMAPRPHSPGYGAGRDKRPSEHNLTRFQNPERPVNRDRDSRTDADRGRTYSSSDRKFEKDRDLRVTPRSQTHSTSSPRGRSERDQPAQPDKRINQSESKTVNARETSNKNSQQRPDNRSTGRDNRQDTDRSGSMKRRESNPKESKSATARDNKEAPKATGNHKDVDHRKTTDKLASEKRPDEKKITEDRKFPKPESHRGNAQKPDTDTKRSDSQKVSDKKTEIKKEAEKGRDGKSQQQQPSSSSQSKDSDQRNREKQMQDRKEKQTPSKSSDSQTPSKSNERQTGGRSSERQTQDPKNRDTHSQDGRSKSSHGSNRENKPGFKDNRDKDRRDEQMPQRVSTDGGREPGPVHKNPRHSSEKGHHRTDGRQVSQTRSNERNPDSHHHDKNPRQAPGHDDRHHRNYKDKDNRERSHGEEWNDARREQNQPNWNVDMRNRMQDEDRHGNDQRSGERDERGNWQGGRWEEEMKDSDYRQHREGHPEENWDARDGGFENADEYGDEDFRSPPQKKDGNWRGRMRGRGRGQGRGRGGFHAAPDADFDSRRWPEGENERKSNERRDRHSRWDTDNRPQDQDLRFPPGRHSDSRSQNDPMTIQDAVYSFVDVLKEFINILQQPSEEGMHPNEVLRRMGPEERAQVVQLQRMTQIDDVSKIARSLETLRCIDPQVVEIMGSMNPAQINDLITSDPRMQSLADPLVHQMLTQMMDGSMEQGLLELLGGIPRQGPEHNMQAAGSREAGGHRGRAGFRGNQRGGHRGHHQGVPRYNGPQTEVVVEGRKRGPAHTWGRGGGSHPKRGR